MDFNMKIKDRDETIIIEVEGWILLGIYST